MTGYLLARIRHIAEDEGFFVNEKKTRVLKQSSAMAVTGVIVNRRPGVRRRDVRRLRAILHNSRKHGLASQNRDDDPHFEARIRGQIAFVQMINPDQSRPLLAALNAISGRLPIQAVVSQVRDPAPTMSRHQRRLAPLQEAADRGIAFETDGDFVRVARFAVCPDLGQ